MAVHWQHMVYDSTRYGISGRTLGYFYFLCVFMQISSHVHGEAVLYGPMHAYLLWNAFPHLNGITIGYIRRCYCLFHELKYAHESRGRTGPF